MNKIRLQRMKPWAVSMECPKCGGFGHCYGTRGYSVGKQRYRKCKECGHRWSSWEEREDRDIRAYGSSVPGADDRQEDLFGKHKT